MAIISIQPCNGFLAVFTPWNPAFLTEFKATVPASARSFDGKTKAWLIEPRWQESVLPLIEKHYQQVLQPVSEVFLTTEPITRKIRLEYLGQCKPRPDGSVSATGWADGGWSVIVPEKVLQEFFQGQGGESLYTLLGVQESATAIEIKSGYRRAARTYHPDVNHEPEAPEMFRRVQEAYEILSDPQRKRKYDAGLYFERSQNNESLRRSRWEHYVSPYRCGLLNVTGRQSVKGFVVETIHTWTEIRNEQGQVMNVSWPKGGDHFVTLWEEESL
jgi:hypothetical protein